MEKYLDLPATPISFQCPLSLLPCLLPGPEGGAGPSFLQKLPKSSAMYYLDTNKNEEPVTSSRLSPVKIVKRGASAPSFSVPSRLLVFPAPRGWGPSRVGEMQTNFSNRNLTQVDRGPCKKPPNCAITLLSTLPWLQQELDLENLPLFADSDSPHPLSHPIPIA